MNNVCFNYIFPLPVLLLFILTRQIKKEYMKNGKLSLEDVSSEFWSPVRITCRGRTTLKAHPWENEGRSEARKELEIGALLSFYLQCAAGSITIHIKWFTTEIFICN